MPALITPFDEGEEIDLDAHAENVARLFDRGIGGVVIGGSNGEGPYLEPGDRTVLTATARTAVAEAFVMTGIAAESLRTAIAQVREAEGGGADAVLVMTPTTLVRHRYDLVEAFYRDLADESQLPVFLYSVPRVTGFELPMESAMSLATHPNIVGMKDSGGDHVRGATIAAQAGEFHMFIGASAAVAPGVASGAYGAITASANYAPELVARVVDGARSGGAGGAHETLLALSGAVERFGVAGVKHAAGITGLTGRGSRRPLQQLDDASRSVIEEALIRAGVTGQVA
jgi:dihydrodipicolinate synthase/N-acetylneuraminate lyase